MKMFLNKSAYADNNLSVKNENINGAIVKVNDKYIYHDEINGNFSATVWKSRCIIFGYC